MEGDGPGSFGADGPDATDQHRMNEEFNDMQGVDVDPQHNNQQLFEQSIPEEHTPDVDTGLSTDARNEAANNMDTLLSEEQMAEDEEDDKIITAAKVRGWDREQTAEHLRQIGVDRRQCKILEEKQVSGDVLLKMNQKSILSQYLDSGLMGQRLKTWQKIRQFQQDVESGALRDEPSSPVENAVEETNASDQDPLLVRSFKHPYTWREEMAGRLQIKETSDVQPVDLLDDLDPKWVDQHPMFLHTMTAEDRSLYEEAKFRLRISQDDPNRVERATSSMCANWLDKFNEHRKFNKYRAR